MDVTNIAIVGAGKGGYEFLRVLVNTPNVNIKYVCDVNPNAKGIFWAHQHEITCVTHFAEILQDPDIDLIFESTGRKDVFEELNRKKLPQTSLVGSAGTLAIFSLLDRYNETNQSLQSYKLNLERRIIERTEELEKANIAIEKERAACERLYEKQRELNEEKSKYLVHTTHQLKAPFAAIQNYVEIILDGYTGEIGDATRDIINKIKIRCELLSETIADMLELSKLQSHMVSIIKTDTDLCAIIKEIADRFSVTATAKKIVIDQIIPDKPLVVLTVEKQVFEILNILVENAIKYSPLGSRIELHLVAQSANRARITVLDYGIGIPPENITKIFTEFFRSNNAVHFEPNGNGLGLAIVQEIASLLGTKVEVASEVGRGTRFWFDL